MKRSNSRETVGCFTEMEIQMKCEFHYLDLTGSSGLFFSFGSLGPKVLEPDLLMFQLKTEL